MNEMPWGLHATLDDLILILISSNFDFNVLLTKLVKTMEVKYSHSANKHIHINTSLYTRQM